MSSYEASLTATYESLRARGYGREAALHKAQSITHSVNPQVSYTSAPRSSFDMSGMSNTMPSYSRSYHGGQGVHPNVEIYSGPDYSSSYSSYPFPYGTYENYNTRVARPLGGRGSLHTESEYYPSASNRHRYETSWDFETEYDDYPQIPHAKPSHAEYSSSHYSSGYQTRTAVPNGTWSYEAEYVSPPQAHQTRNAAPPSSSDGSYKPSSSGRRRRATTSNDHYSSSHSSRRSPRAATEGIGRKPEIDLYEVLGVSRSASAEELKTVHRKLSMKNHPDRAKGDRAAATDKMAEINRAYDVLKDEEKRMHYDRFGEVFDRL